MSDARPRDGPEVSAVAMASAGGTALAGLVNAYEAAANSHDLETIMAMFAEGAEFEMVGSGTLVGKEQIRAIHAYDAGINTRLQITNCVRQGTTVTCQAVEHNDWLATAGLGDIHYPSIVFTFQDGLIRRISATMAAESSAAIRRVLQAFAPWIARNYPNEFAKLFTPEGAFIYSRENGARVVGLLKAWRAGQ